MTVDPRHPSQWEPTDSEPAPSASELVEQFLAASAQVEPRQPVNVLGPMSEEGAKAIAAVETPDLLRGLHYLLDQGPAFQLLTINQAKYREGL